VRPSFRVMSFLTLSVYTIEKISAYLSVKDLANLELSCRTLYSHIEEAGVWKSKFQYLSRIYQYKFISNIECSEWFTNVAEEESSLNLYKILTGLVLQTHRSFKKYFQGCFWEEERMNKIKFGEDECQNEEVIDEDVDEISLKEFIFTKGDSLLFNEGYFFIDDSDFPDIAAGNRLYFVASDVSKFLCSYTSWLEEYLIFIDKYFDVLREQVFLAH